MNESISCLFRFLEQFEPSVTGHALEAIDPGLKAKVQAFAGGTLPASERPGMIRELQAEPRLQELFTRAVKDLRPAVAPRPPTPSTPSASGKMRA